MTWNPEKVNKCEEIKFGTKFRFIDETDYMLVVGKKQDGFLYVSENRSMVSKWIIFFSDMVFFRPDGTVIKPPVDMVKVDLYEVISKQGVPWSMLYSEDAKYYFSRESMHLSLNNKNNSIVIKRVIKTVEVPPYL